MVRHSSNSTTNPMNDIPAQILALATVSRNLTEKLAKVGAEIAESRRLKDQVQPTTLLIQETALTNLLASYTNERIELLKLLSAPGITTFTAT